MSPNFSYDLGISSGISDAARRKRPPMLSPFDAEHSKNTTLKSVAFFYPCSVVTALLSSRSILFPTTIIKTSVPLSFLTSLIHFSTLLND